ncbi:MULTISPECIES: MarR family winged helix-turn-helix transcriptional regulator [unclassified Pseudactinotalea]|uniref:MarR family winged helix-turn-helix transcriptional regulator n=1 Tax=unclassified Pseudactinotalea TaxID=2649176 RepID=UPI00128C2CA4|nr:MULTISPECIES: MarR family transcriptional regulator [unclassified Pseudactinotalea]MPV50477.1 MarR family transcriptional regulator [Pseudactinotalea sp. HY160]QGH70500.1 MarR family transcriptional regulator [Pseudactinotalea sp. HY158]
MTTTPTRWLSPAEQRSWRAYLTGSAGLAEALNRDLELASGLSLNEYEVLVRLSELPERRSRMAALAASLVHSRSRLTHTVARLERRGYVSRRQCAGDGRGVEAVLMDDGHAALVAAAPGHVESVRRHLVDVLTPEQLAAVGEAFAAIAHALGRESAGPGVAE